MGAAMKGTRCIVAVVLCAFACGTASAAYLDNITLKIDRGFSNALGCWLEIPYQTYATAREKGVMAGGPMGLGKGILLLPCRLVSGVIDIATFPAPCPRKGWNGWMEPQYNPWVEQPDQAGPGEQPAAAQPVVEPAPAPVEQPGPAQ